jgi:hypothetical protein
VTPRPLFVPFLATAFVAGCGEEAPPDPREPGEVSVQVGWSGEGVSEWDAAVQEILERWRALQPTAPLPDVELRSSLREGMASGTGDAREPDAGTVNRAGAPLSDGPPRLALSVDDPSGDPFVDPALSSLARELVLLAREARRRQPPFPLSLLAGGTDLLDRAVEEGVTDLLAHLVSGRHPAPELLAWGRQREEELWQAFQEVADRRSAAGWYAGILEEEDSPPADPIRFVGYRIVESVWARSSDRPGLVTELVRMQDPSDLADRSIYGGHGPGPHSPPTTRNLPMGPWPRFECHPIRVGDGTRYGCAGGEGTVPVILLVGPGEDHRAWHRIAPAMAGITRVVVVDPPAPVDEEDGADASPPAPGTLHQTAGLVEILAGPGPYVLAGTGPAEDQVLAFAALHPWRVGAVHVLGAETSHTAWTGPEGSLRPLVGIPVLGDTDPSRHLEAPDDVVRVLTAQVEDLEGRGSTGSAAALGEPRGCWEAQSPGIPFVDRRILRLAHTPRGGGAAGGASHPVHDLAGGPSSRMGDWHPLGRERIRLELAGDGPVPLRGEIQRIGGGTWTGWVGGDRAPGHASLSLRPHPCELPE